MSLLSSDDVGAAAGGRELVRGGGGGGLPSVKSGADAGNGNGGKLGKGTEGGGPGGAIARTYGLVEVVVRGFSGGGGGTVPGASAAVAAAIASSETVLDSDSAMAAVLSLSF